MSVSLYGQRRNHPYFAVLHVKHVTLSFFAENCLFDLEKLRHGNVIEQHIYVNKNNIYVLHWIKEYSKYVTGDPRQ